MICTQHGLGAMVLRYAGVVNQCHSDNIGIENVGPRSWKILWRRRRSARAKWSLRPTLGSSVCNQTVCENTTRRTMRFALVLSDSLEQQRAAVRSFREDFHLLLQMKDRALGDDRLMKVLRHAATMI